MSTSYRITTNGTMRLYRANLNNSRTSLNNAMTQVQTGRTFNSYMEDPATASRCFQMRRSFWRASDQYTNNNYVTSKFQTAWSVMDDVVDGTVEEDGGLSAMYEALRALNDPTASGRKPLAQTTAAKAESIVKSMNSQYSGTFIFAGDDGLNVPFEWGTNALGDKVLLYRGIDVNSTDPGEEIQKDDFTRQYVLNLGGRVSATTETDADGNEVTTYSMTQADYENYVEGDMEELEDLQDTITSGEFTKTVTVTVDYATVKTDAEGNTIYETPTGETTDPTVYYTGDTTGAEEVTGLTCDGAQVYRVANNTNSAEDSEDTENTEDTEDIYYYYYVAVTDEDGNAVTDENGNAVYQQVQVQVTTDEDGTQTASKLLYNTPAYDHTYEEKEITVATSYADYKTAYDTEKAGYEQLQKWDSNSNIYNSATYVDLGLGLKEDSNGDLIQSSAFDSALSGITFLGYGKDEDGDPLNVVSITLAMSDILDRCDPDSGDFASEQDREDFNRLTNKLDNAIDSMSEQHVALSSTVSYLDTNNTQISDTAYMLNTQIEELEQVDPALAITALSWAQYSYNAGLKIGNSILSQSLLDYMS